MTPEELLNKWLHEVRYIPMNLNKEKLLSLIQQAKSEWCKKQRGLCVKAYYENDDPDIGNMTAISNAPEPH